MRNLHNLEVVYVSGAVMMAPMECTVGIPSGISCTGTLSQWEGLYDDAVDFTSRDIIGPVANTVSSAYDSTVDWVSRHVF